MVPVSLSTLPASYSLQPWWAAAPSTARENVRAYLSMSRLLSALPFRMRFAQLALLFDERLIETQARRVHLAGFGGGDHRTARLVQVRAIVELAAPDVGPELGHGVSDVL